MSNPKTATEINAVPPLPPPASLETRRSRRSTFNGIRRVENINENADEENEAPEPASLRGSSPETTDEEPKGPLAQDSTGEESTNQAHSDIVIPPSKDE